MKYRLESTESLKETTLLCTCNIDMGNPGKTEKICKVCRGASFKGYKAPDLYIVDARKNEAASKYKPLNVFRYGLFDPHDIMGVGVNMNWSLI